MTATVKLIACLDIADLNMGQGTFVEAGFLGLADCIDECGESQVCRLLPGS